MGILERMSLLRLSRLLPLLALVSACGGKRADPEPSQNPPATQEGGGGNGTGGIPSNGGAPSTGGMGGTPGTGGMGGAPGTGGMGGEPGTGGMAGAPGTGGGTFNDVSAMYPYCGCLDDSKEPGACENCFIGSIADMECNPAGACDAGCQAIITFIRTNVMCTFVDEACLQAAFAVEPSEWDDAVDKLKCACDLCPAPFGCESVVCGG
jgi:hypothetical protein